jgi:hypothetical protein
MFNQPSELGNKTGNRLATESITAGMVSSNLCSSKVKSYRKGFQTNTFMHILITNLVSYCTGASSDTNDFKFHIRRYFSEVTRDDSEILAPLNAFPDPVEGPGRQQVQF